MTFTEHDYDCVARYLDGEAIELTADQQTLLTEFATDEAATVIAPAGVPSQAQVRARHRLHQAAGAQRRRHRIGTAGAILAGAAAAAIIAIVAIGGALRSSPAPQTPETPLVVSDIDVDIELLASEIELLALDIESLETEALLTLLNDEAASAETDSEEDAIAHALLQSDVEVMLEYFN
jgi:hypothetical protein